MENLIVDLNPEGGWGLRQEGSLEMLEALPPQVVVGSQILEAIMDSEMVIRTLQAIPLTTTMLKML